MLNITPPQSNANNSHSETLFDTRHSGKKEQEEKEEEEERKGRRRKKSHNAGGALPVKV